MMISTYLVLHLPTLRIKSYEPTLTMQRTSGLNAPMMLVKDLTPTLRSLACSAVAAQRNSYCPYSNFFVGAAMLHKDGSVTTGCNWENSILQSTCAERTAIVAANSAGKRQCVAIAVFGSPVLAEAPTNEELTSAVLETGEKEENPAAPCGLCRQMLTEVAQLSEVDMEVVMVGPSRIRCKVMKLSDLLPFSFGPSDLNIDLHKWATGVCDPPK
jgi:cytidine deaminase